MLITGIFPPFIGGPSTYVFKVSKMLAENGMKVRVLTYGSPSFEIINDVEVYRVPIPFFNSVVALFFRIFIATIKAVILGKDCDLIFIHDPFLAGIPGFFAKKNLQ